jgi:hypothetical protein
MRPTRDQSSVAGGGCEFRIMVNRIGIASSRAYDATNAGVSVISMEKRSLG